MQNSPVQIDREQKLSPTQWRLLILLIVSVFINYIDRSNLSVSATDIQKEIMLSADNLGSLHTAFFVSYGLSLILAGWLVDRFNVHWVLGLGFLLWTLATAATGFLNTFYALLAIRVLLGVGESVAYPSYSKIISSDFSEGQRGRANAFIDAGSKMGPALGTFIGGMIVVGFGWRALFLILGFVPLLWLPFWYLNMPKTRAAARKIIDPKLVPGMLELLSKRSVWGTCFGLFAINYAWYFMLSWFPYYLEHERHFSKEKMAVLGSLPFLMTAIASTFCGWLSDRLIRGGKTPTLVRKGFVIFGLLMTTLLLPAAMAPSDTVSMGLFLFACLCFGFTTSNVWALTQSIAGPSAAGKWTGLQNAFGNFFGGMGPFITGKIVDSTNSFHYAFVAVAVMVTLGAMSFAFVVGRVEPMKWRPHSPLTRDS